MDAAGEVIFVLKLIVAVGPLAVYFLSLGLVNSQARPALIPCKNDFSMLSLAFLPLLVLPAVQLVDRPRAMAAAALVSAVAVAVLLWRLRRERGWVVYNLDARQCAAAVRQACGRLGWRCQATADGFELLPVHLRLEVSTWPLLRNVTLRVRRSTDEGRDARVDQELRFARALEETLGERTLLPSPTGAAMVLVGAALLGLPLWYLFQHMEAVATVIRQYWPV